MSPHLAEPDSIWTRGASALSVALLGRETRYVGRLYAERIFIFAALVLAVVLSLDAANHLSSFLSTQHQPGAPSGLVRLSRYLLLRGGYNLPAILPIAALAGVVWAEFALAHTRQRIMISNSGQPSLRSLAPAVVVGLGIGLMQFVALAYVRPASVEAQAVEGFRYYGPKFEAGETDKKWISVEGAVIAARIAFTAPPSLRDVVIYDLGADGSLQLVRTAQSAVPEEKGRWTLVNGTEWAVPGFSSPTTTLAPDNRQVDYFDGQSIPLALDPLWVENIEILPPLLPQSILQDLGTATGGIQNASTYKAALQERFAAIFYVMGMVLLPAAFGIAWFLPRMGPGPLIRVLVWGISGYFVASMVSQLGSYGYLPAWGSAWAAPVVFIGASIWIVLGRSVLPKI